MTQKSFLFHWEKDETRSVFKTTKKIPFTFKEREKIASKMTVKEILDVNVHEEDEVSILNVCCTSSIFLYLLATIHLQGSATTEKVEGNTAPVQD